MSDYDSGTIQWNWVFISMAIFFVAQVILGVVFTIFGVLTLGIGFLLFIIFKPIVYFIGGFITGKLSPGLTIKEPAIGALIMVVLGTIFDSSHSTSGLGWLILSSIIAFGCALFGAQIGESK